MNFDQFFERLKEKEKSYKQREAETRKRQLEEEQETLCKQIERAQEMGEREIRVLSLSDEAMEGLKKHCTITECYAPKSLERGEPTFTGWSISMN